MVKAKVFDFSGYLRKLGLEAIGKQDTFAIRKDLASWYEKGKISDEDMAIVADAIDSYIAAEEAREEAERIAAEEAARNAEEQAEREVVESPVEEGQEELTVEEGQHIEEGQEELAVEEEPKEA